MMTRARNALLMASAFAATAVPAHALDIVDTLKDLTGARNERELGGPLLIAVLVLAIVFFWIASRIGKWRQKRVINKYHNELDEFSSKLRRTGHR